MHDMNTSFYKTFVFEVGVEYPNVGYDDVFELEIGLTTEEINSIVENGKKQLWLDNELEPCEYLESFAKTAFERACKLAEEYAVKRWGSRLTLEQGAKYSFFLPDEISDAIFESEECDLFKNKSREIETISKERFHSDTRILYEHKEKCDWGKLIQNDKHWDNQPFGGQWSHTLGKIASQYDIHTNLNCGSQTIKISYAQKYQLDSKILELSLFPTQEDIENLIKQKLIDNAYKITEILPIGEPKYSWVLYAEGKKDESDVYMYIDILDQIAKME